MIHTLSLHSVRADPSDAKTFSCSLAQMSVLVPAWKISDLKQMSGQIPRVHVEVVAHTNAHVHGALQDRVGS
jgi:hypothetical protein